jgi:hypothetical protein
LWLKGESILGNIAGTIVVFGAAAALILRERVQLDRITQACLDQGSRAGRAEAFARYAITRSSGCSR